MAKFNTHYIPSAAAVAAVVALSLLPIGPPQLLRGVSLLDKWTHFAMYGCLTATLLIDRRLNGAPMRWLMVTLCVAVLGAVLEACQYPLPYRTFEWLDMLANALGATLGTLLTAAILKISRKNN
ncbi:MAG: VanZ family protein [Paludibacteraceae bacterium]|nr:VanZ family protein [Paludibacteraceae bacterium]